MADFYVKADGSGDGSTWALAASWATFVTWMVNTANAGDDAWMLEGAYTGTAVVSARDGTMAAPITITGVTSATTAEPPTQSDYATTEADRPTIDMGANSWNLDNYWRKRYLDITGSVGILSRIDVGSRWVGCKINNTRETAGVALYGGGGSTHMIECEATCANGAAILTSINSVIDGCYIHDSVTGVDSISSRLVVTNCLIADCSTAGINQAASTDPRYHNNTIDNCGIGIVGNGTTGASIRNNHITNCTSGIGWGSAAISTELDWNNFHGNGVDIVAGYVIKGPHTQAIDPQYEDTASGNYRPRASVLGASAFPGATTPSYAEIGAVHNKPAAARLINGGMVA